MADKVFAALDVDNTQPFALIILNSLDGSLIKYYYSGSLKMGLLRRDSIMLIDTSDKVIVASNIATTTVFFGISST